MVLVVIDLAAAAASVSYDGKITSMVKGHAYDGKATPRSHRRSHNSPLLFLMYSFCEFYSGKRD